jgi:hypothetical protein
MLVIRRTEGQWVEVTHVATGDVLRLRLYGLTVAGRVNVAFDDLPRKFKIRRGDTTATTPAASRETAIRPPECERR